MEKVYNIVDNQIIYENGKIKKFFSYGTLIATIDMEKKEIILTDYYNFSRTTARHLKTFLEKFTMLNYSNTKELEKYIKTGIFEDYKIKVEK